MRNVVLTDHQAELVERLVGEGGWQNASEVMREDLHLVEDKAGDVRAHVRALREAARFGIADIEDGRYWTFGSAADLGRHLGSVRDRTLANKPER